MFDESSRYNPIDTATLTVKGPDGGERAIVYRRRRFLPPDEAGITLAEHKVAEGERLDNLTALYLSDPTLFWRVCDANPVLHPRELTARIGQVVRVTLPEE